MAEPKVALVVLTLNEEAIIEECLNQFRPYIDYILVVDGESKDRTVELAEKIADRVVVKTFSDSRADDLNYAWSLIPESVEWIVWSDADEIWDKDFLTNIKKKMVEADVAGVVCFRFPRRNLFDPKLWPDYQVRFIRNSLDFRWGGHLIHTVPWWKSEGIPLDQADLEDRAKRFGVANADRYTIIHMRAHHIYAGDQV